MREKINEILHLLKGTPWLWSYGSWIYNNICNQCILPLNVVSSNPAHGEEYQIWYYIYMQWSLSLTCDRSVVFSRYFGFLH